jgi:alpha-glucosidase
MTKKASFKWWQTGIIYEVYIRSFQDSNGDGVGDIKGIIQRLDYLQWLGITALWITPFYPSPMKDFGYDISDYTDVHPLFGNMEDFDDLISEVYRRGMKLIIDMVPNHTSDQHPWFLASRSSRKNSKRDWYIWKDARSDESPPNNWLGVLGGSAWEWDKNSGQYYYHAFLKEQPDLNLKNPEVVTAILNVMKFWLDKGVDGFRIDVMWHLAKDDKWRDNPVNPNYKSFMPDCDQLLQVYSCDQPEVHDIIYKFRELLDQYDDKVMMGELYLPIDKVVGYYGADNKGAHMPGNFQLLFLPWEASQLGIAIDQYEAALPSEAWPNWVIGNHDRSRLINRIGEKQARVAALLLLTLRGTPVLYYGDEIGMQTIEIPDDELQDPQGLLMPGKNLSRDGIRIPMQWDASPNAGFTRGKPWLRLDENYSVNNVLYQQKDNNSLLSFYRQVIGLRKIEPSLSQGGYYPVVTDGATLSYMRIKEGHVPYLIILNLTDQAVIFNPIHKTINGKLIFSTLSSSEEEVKPGRILTANEGLLAQMLNPY